MTEYEKMTLSMMVNSNIMQATSLMIQATEYGDETLSNEIEKLSTKVIANTNEVTEKLNKPEPTLYPEGTEVIYFGDVWTVEGGKHSQLKNSTWIKNATTGQKVLAPNEQILKNLNKKTPAK